jgi:hypothetical protein
MNRKKTAFASLLLLLFVMIGNFPVFSQLKTDLQVFDKQAPDYFVRFETTSGSTITASYKQHILQNQQYEHISFRPDQPWILFLLIESSKWVSPIEQNAAILTLLDKIDLPPSSIETYLFHTSIEKRVTDWKIPVLQKESDQAEVALFDSIQRVNQIIEQQNKNSLLCIIASGQNTVNMIRYPLPVCPIWFFVPTEPNRLQSPYAVTLSQLSGGETHSFLDLEEMESVHLPIAQETTILHFSVPMLWLQLNQRIPIQITMQDFSDTLVVWYPIPWWSWIGFAVLCFTLSGIVIYWLKHRRRDTCKQNFSNLFCLAWLEWNELPGKKLSKRIHSSDFTIGSNPNCHLSLHDNSISDYHALIQEKGMSFFVTDLSSRTGIMVNQKSVSNKQLLDGDQIQIGNIILTFRQSHIKYESNEKLL